MLPADRHPADHAARRFQTAVDIGLGIVFAAVLAAMATQLARQGRPWLFDLAVGSVVCVAALLRARSVVWPLGIGLSVTAAAGLVARFEHLPREPGAAATLALLVLAGAAVRTLPVGFAPVVVGAGIAVTAIDWITVDSPLRSAHGPLFQLGTVVWCISLAVGLWLRLADHRRRTAAEAVRRGERLELAAELHDVMAHHVTGIVLQAQGARIAARKDPASLDTMLAAIEQAGTDALAATRRVVGLLRDTDDAATTSPGPEQLTELVRRFGERHQGPAIRLDLPEAAAPWPPEVTNTVYRIVQESLTNISRHAAHARSATVSVAQDREAVTVEITDDAPPSSPRHPHRGGFGLIGMRERVEALGGSLLAGPLPETGWSVCATLPVAAGERR